MRFRPGTLDKWIYDRVYTYNEYEITEEMVRDKIVIDIGSHCGYFSKLCLDLGARKVYAFEMDKENYLLSKENNAEYQNRFFPTRCAVWKSGQQSKIISYPDYPIWNGKKNTGGTGIVFEEGDNKTWTTSLDRIIVSITEKYGGIDLLKIDAESSEWPILLTSNYVNQIPIILGEYHEIGGEFDDNDITMLDLLPSYHPYDLDLLQTFFEHMNYEFRSTRYTNLNIGHFWAMRKD